MMDRTDETKALLLIETSDMRPEESRKLIQELREAIAHTKDRIQTTRGERERIDRNMEQNLRCMLKGGQLVQSAAKLGEALRALDAVRNRNQALSQQLVEQEATLSRSSGLGEINVFESYLETQQSLTETQSHCQAAEKELQVFQDQAAEAASSQSLKTEEDQPADASVAEPDTPATVRDTGARPRRRGRPKK
ncbi:hypothetical protein GJAV_G00212030 [Gymnothorax javanicus]|nr:hypothetical protein GJAV_G00212030 [Gymnothorax javanicus]